MIGRKLFIVKQASQAKSLLLSQITEFIPVITTKRSTDQYFGGYLVDKPDNRTLKEFKSNEMVLGLELLEGGNAKVRVNVNQIFESEADAKRFLDKTDDKNLLSVEYLS